LHSPNLYTLGVVLGVSASWRFRFSCYYMANAIIVASCLGVQELEGVEEGADGAGFGGLVGAMAKTA
jgi:hypothetical protein